MSIDPKRELEAAWADRRAAFALDGPGQRAGLEAALARLERASVSLEDDSVEQAHAFHLRAHVLSDLERHDEAKRLWSRSVEILRSAGDALALAHKVRHLGDAALRGGSADEARAHYAEALGLHRAQHGPPTLDLANLLRRVALLEEESGAAKAAIEHWQEARALYDSFGLSEGVGEADVRLSVLSASR